MKFYYIFSLLFFLNIYSQKQNKTFGFIENKGQIVDQKGRKNNAVKYLLNTSGLNVQLRENGFSYDIYETKKHPLTKKQKERLYPSRFIKEDTLKNPNYTLEYIYHRIDIDFDNSNSTVKLIAEEKSSDYDNYYNILNEPNGILEVHKFQKITYKNIYNNIDVVFFMPEDKSKSVEYNFIVNEGGKISDIQLKFNGVKTELVDNKIKMNVRFGQMEETMPLSWTEIDGAKKEITVGYKKIEKNVYGFESSEDLNNKKVVIDPVPMRLWGTLYGDKTNNYYSLGTVNNTIDSYGNLYMSGSTSASNSSFATAGAHQNYIPTSQYLCTNGIIVKFDPNGTRLWGTYYGGINYNDIRGIKADSQNNIVIAGRTQSPTNISTFGSHQENNQGGTDAYIVKFNELGVRVWGTYVGGNSDDFAFGLDIDNLNNIYIVGGTSSVSGIAYNSNFQSQLFQSISGYGDAFIAKFDSTGTIIWSTYAGGENFESFNAVVVKGNQIAAVGYTRSETNISTNGVFQESIYPNGQIDGMIYKFSNNGNRLWSSYYGGDNIEEILSVEIDDDDNIYIGGQTASSSNMTTSGSFQFSSQELYKGFFAKLSTIGARLWGSYLDDLNVYSIIFKNNSIYLGATGSSNNQDLTNYCSFNRNLNSESLGYIGKFSKNCAFIWGTFLGGDAMNGGFVIDYATKLSIDNSNNIYVSGITSSNNLITDSNSHQQNMLGLLNYYSMKFLENSPNVINVSSNSPTCIGGNLSLTANGGTNYSWTGPNGFTSNQQNPTITNVNSTNSGQYSCMITGSSSCDGIKTVNVIVEDITKPIPNINPLPTITGDCTTSITAPIALDNCAGTITATTSDPLSYSLPGTYTIHWNYNDGNGNIETQTQSVTINSVALPNINSPQTFCIQQNATLSSIIISGTNIKWYDAATGGNLLTNSTVLVNGTTYFASQTINSCESLRVPVTISIQNTPAPNGAANQILCSNTNPTLSSINISGTAINWYATNNSTTILPNTTALINGTSLYATQTINGCESMNRLAVNVTLITTLNANNYSQSFCDDLNDGTENVVLSNYNTNLIASTTGITFSYYTSFASAENQIISDELNLNYNLSLGLHTVYVRLDSTNGCHQVVELHLSLFPKPIILIKDIMPICSGKTIVVNAGSGFNSYNWSTGATSQSIIISIPGTYSVTVTKNYGLQVCSSTKTFTVVLSQIATITSITTEDWTDIENVIIVNTSGNGIYQYSIDGINYQDSNTFTGLLSGFYTVYVRDKNECGSVDENVFLLNYPKFFTPNNDGFNDFWRIIFSQVEPNLTVIILDRYGKLITTIKSNSPGWDGTYNGKQMPSDDYWFVVHRENGQEHRAHFALKR